MLRTKPSEYLPNRKTSQVAGVYSRGVVFIPHRNMLTNWSGYEKMVVLMVDDTLIRECRDYVKRSAV